ncbi:hypothetical protein ACFWIO_11885 [Streptomyces diastatochromogenes]|uniref:hypothetical protein n=1 Tax=Streptomyces diastatochromogenes TaxID=42236 RepID=UPI0036504CE6
MRKLTKRISLAAASAAVAGGAVLGAGGTASAAVPESAHVERTAVGVTADDYRSERGVTHQHDREDGYRAREHSDRYTDWDRYGRHGHVYRWDDGDCDWKRDSDSRDHRYRYDRDHRYARDGRDSLNRSDHDWNRSYSDWGRNR